MRNFESEYKGAASPKRKKSGIVIGIISIVVLLIGAFFVAKFLWESGQGPNVNTGNNKKETLFSDATGVVDRGDVVTLPPQTVIGTTSAIVDSDGNTKYVFTDENGAEYEVTEPPETGETMSRRDGVYTFLIAGLDESKLHADVIMLATYDSINQTLNAMSIPRDTYSVANERAGYLKHLTLAYQSGGIDNLLYEVYNMVGFYPDYYVTVDWNGFIAIINYIGGVSFNVPVYMDVEGTIVQPGYQWLSGTQALAVCRYRDGYFDADIGRIRTRDAFIKATANQLLSGSSIVRIAEIAGAVYDNVGTNISEADFVWFAKNAVGMDTANIQFVTFPGGPASDSGMWIPYPNELRGIINEKLNPYNKDIVTINVVSRSENYGK